jgi:hypothetical protein
MEYQHDGVGSVLIYFKIHKGIAMTEELVKCEDVGKEASGYT